MTSTDAPSQGAKGARGGKRDKTRSLARWARLIRRVPRTALNHARTELRRIAGTRTWAVVRATTMAGVAYRVTGLAGEAAFFALLSLPPFVLGLIGILAHLSTFLGPDVVQEVRRNIEEQAHVLFTDNAVDRVVTPLLDDVLGGGQVPLISLGFLLSLWSGSRALFVYVDLISVAYGLGEKRGIIRTRIMSFGLYIVALLIAPIVMPVLVVGPTLLVGVIPAPYAVMVDVLYWPVLVAGSVLFLTVLYHVSVPVRTRWWREVPGAVLALVIWIICAAVLRAVLAAWFTPLSVYGSLAAPIAVLLWLYITALAVLIGATLNAEVDRLWPVEGAPRPGRTAR
ncbi:YihY/virulence factor BrkB family protein [Spongiactinospora gelatinilytica]|uniref:YihY/virulence factor BrkB family protein n=1 Tax=Spongiactinospora gelatinilytica TaxID=2666298 RepID=A0A2W2F818_9ACTN|nr:YihY/virulence factor BrkB family protein [Spongiactinospora gelatinilytica]